MNYKKLNVIYRISDKSNANKVKIADKWQCLQNAVKIFGAENIFVIANDCENETLNTLKNFNLRVLAINTGSNSGSFNYVMDKVIENYSAEDCIYLLEDDYFHLPKSREAILEGLEIADYVTLYDHPDLYHYDGNGPNFFVHGDFPKSSIYITKNTHWRSNISTTMTFAAKNKTLLEDRAIWRKFSQGKIPMDFPAFILLTKQDNLEEIRYAVQKRGGVGISNLMINIMLENYITERRKRLLISAIPSLSTHTEINFLAPLIDWKKLISEGSF